MPTVKEMRDSLNKLIEKDKNNADLDILVFCQLSAGIERMIIMDISSLDCSSDLDTPKIVGLRLEKTFIELVEMSSKHVREINDERRREKCAN